MAGNGSDSSAGFVFGYGSLSAEGVVGVATLADHVRVWGVAMDNRNEVAGYRYYVDPDSGERPAVHVTFVDLAPAPGVDCVGVLVPVRDAAELAALDRRERNYNRVEVTDRVRLHAGPGDIGGPVWAYYGKASARERYAAAAAAGTAVVASVYLATVEDGFRRAGLWERYVASTQPPQCPVMPLERVDLPGGPWVR